MKFGILLTSVHDASVDPRQQVREHEELVRSAEQLGFDLMVCGQHFLGSDLRYYQPVPWLTHLAAVAPTMRTATGIILLSMVNPVDIAEQMATLDVLTGGRAVCGVGLGYSAHEFDAFGIEPGTRVARFEESLRIVRAMWSGEEVDVTGRFHSVRGARPSVLPIQPGGPPVWIGGQASGAVRRAARLGDAWYAPPFPTHTELASLRRLFLETRAELGGPVDGEFPVRRELLIAPSRAAGLDAALGRYRARYEVYRKWGLSGENTPVQSGDELRADIGERFILGSPAECADALGELERDLGMTDFVFKPHWPGLPHREAMVQLETFGTEVVPQLEGCEPDETLEAGQVGVVTGAASGIGRGLAEAFLRRGLLVVAADVEATALDTAVREMGAVGRVVGQVTDVRDPEALQGLAVRTMEEFGRVDVLCNNAGVISARVPVWEQTPEDWRWTLEVNLIGVVNGVRAFVPRMIAQGHGHVVNTASIAGLSTVPGGGNGAYTASKHAVVGLSETLAEELRTLSADVGVTVVCPGPVPSRIHDAERNRPAELVVEAGVAASLPTPDFQLPLVPVDAATVAEQVCAAIEAGRRYVLPSPGTQAMARRRLDGVLADP